jgi:hypothetical protein
MQTADSIMNISTGEPCAVKVASTVRGGRLEKDSITSTSLVAYPTQTDARKNQHLRRRNPHRAPSLTVVRSDGHRSRTGRLL